MKLKLAPKLYFTRRWRNARPGSVLILVVALLVLLALIGTAYLSSTQAERYSSGQNTINVEADLLLQGVIDTVNARVAGALFDSSGSLYRPPQSNATTISNGYRHYTDTTDDLYLADRLPMPNGNIAIGPQWNQLSWPLFPDTSGNYRFDSPIVPPANMPASIQLGAGASFTKLGFGPYTIPSPTTYAPLRAPNGSLVPSLVIGAYQIMAADTDGDGIPDAGLVKLPIGPIDGITYYYATRIIDTNSAINVNTALSSVSDFNIASNGSPTYVDGLGATTTIASSSTNSNTLQISTPPQGTMPYASAALGMFPSHVGLMQILTDYAYTGVTYDSSDAENVLGYLGQFPGSVTPLSDSSYKWGQANPDSTGTARADFSFISVGDHLASQVARRINYAGLFTYNATYYQHRAFSLSDSAALAAGFCIRSSTRATSDIETQMPDSLVTNVLTSSYNAASALGTGSLQNWYNSIPESYLAAGRPPARTVLTASNAVSDSIPYHYVVNPTNPVDTPNPGMLPYIPYVATPTLPPTYIPANYSSTTTYAPGQCVMYIDPNFTNQPVRCYLCLAIATNNPPIPKASPAASVLDAAHWRLEEAWTSTPQKASVNTADFPTLWRAFYNVMADTGSTIPPLPYISPPVTIPYTSPGWGPFRNPARAATPAAQLAGNNITSGQMLQLRSAIAAINTMDMRNGGASPANNDVSSRTFSLYSDATHTSKLYDVIVYGMKNQPYVTAVVADYDGTKPQSLSIELYNPTDVAINVGNWQLAGITRKPDGTGLVKIDKITGTNQPSIPNGTMIPAGQFLLLQSNVPNTAAGTNEVALTVAGMEVAADPAAPLEVVLLRPRRGDGTYSSAPSPSVPDNAYNTEGSASAPYFSNMVPVDSIDFTGVFTAGVNGAGRRAYERPHGSSSDTVHNNWAFVYPGKYDAVDAGATGTNQTGWGPLQANPGGPIAVGVPYSDGTAVHGNNPVMFQPIQMSTSKLLSPTPITSISSNKYPFSGFARNGDILKVPFIGAYVIFPTGGNSSGTQQVSLVEMNSVTMDAAMATATSVGTYETTMNPATVVTTDTSKIAYIRQDEAIGRFCPLVALDPNQGPHGTGTAYTGTNGDPYGWAAHIFDYLDVNVASDDFFPNVDPRLVDGSLGGTATATNVYKYTESNTPTIAPISVANSSSVASNGNADANLGKQGLININTASSYILQQLPGVSQTMADAIVAYRNANGPFKTIFDLNSVGPGAAAPSVTPTNFAIQTGIFYTREGNIPLFALTPAVPPATTGTISTDNMLSHDPGVSEGDYSPGTLGQNDGVRGDFEEQTLMLNRISNLITTRSDMFTCYVLLQGWRNAGTSTATLAVQRRAAFLLDRGNITPTWITQPNNRPFNFTVPTGSN